MENNELIRYESGLIKRVSNAVNIANKLLALTEPELIPYRKKDKWGFCNADKRIVIECIYDNVGRFSNGLARVETKRVCGFIDTKGNIVIPIIYDCMFIKSDFSDGLAAVAVAGKPGFGFINKAGETIIPFVFEYAKKFTNGLATVRRKDKWGFVNKKGEIAISFSFDHTRMFADGFAKVEIDKRWWFIDKQGDLKIDCSIYDVVYDFEEGKALAQLSGEAGFINQKGEFTKVLSIYEKAFFFTGYYFESLVYDGKNAFVDKVGNVIINFEEYESLGQFSEGLLDVALAINGKCGFVDKTGKIIPCIYDETESFFNGLAKVKLNGKWGYINTSGLQYWED